MTMYLITVKPLMFTWSNQQRRALLKGTFTVQPEHHKTYTKILWTAATKQIYIMLCLLNGKSLQKAQEPNESGFSISLFASQLLNQTVYK